MRKILTVALLCASLSSFGNIRLPNILSSNMVLQQQSKVKLWGAADPNEKIAITTSWDNKAYEVIATNNARWEILVETPAAGGPFTITLKGKNTIVLNNILIGEVWVCSGQSNMEMNGMGVEGMKEELPVSRNPNIRFFHIPKTTSLHPQDNCAGEWTICDSSTLKSFSAVGYFFGKRLNSNLNIPIGLVNASWGGTAAEIWTPDSIINADPVLKQAATKISIPGGRPYIPGYAFNGMIAPITNYAIAGTIWYQGENNTGTAKTYAKLLATMIDSWRTLWQKDFPFYLVQIAPYKYGIKNSGALLREAETQVADHHPNTGMVVITDLVADTNNVHPTNKKDVGLRLANLALAETYHKNGFAYKSPAFKSLNIKGNKAIVTLDSAVQVKGKTATEFVIAGEDQVFYPADVSIKNNTLTVSSKEVKTPVAVRFGFRNTAVGNVFSKEGLPLAPFRTDSWEVEMK
ncbi:sialate O-acetylesterase [Chitinophaga sp. SYP-B3965]|uniref:sialate O-acetylesterase n=1 Tax=Chitinophaga sp. SYP-B3965 TaxID=2663120 RepID=UPI00129A08EC|nr:sialate O-acetylesterase [Chitinophaga sp. SYP-B3965]MRG47153.1 sialate O-acetylesterase [Chitinophaga sp. SYP-B3965]